MSDYPTAPDWWQASDGKWYPPESHPQAQPPPPGPPPPYPSTPPPPPHHLAAPLAAPGQFAPQKPWWQRWWAILLAIVIVLGVIGAIADPADDDLAESDETVSTPEATLPPPTANEPTTVQATDSEPASSEAETRSETIEVGILTDEADWSEFTRQIAAAEPALLERYDDDTLGALIATNCDMMEITGDVGETFSLLSIADGVSDREAATLLGASINVYCPEWAQGWADWLEAPDTDAANATSDSSPEVVAGDLTPSEQNAARSALSYLELTGFSRQGLIDQLSSDYGDQFPIADATAAVDSLNVDWDAEATESAQSYLELSGFSRQGLIDQLSSEYGDKYTIEQATSAVDGQSVDWNAEATESAQSYLELSGFSCQGLIDQLSSEYGDKYTIEQATQAATQAGIC